MFKILLQKLDCFLSACYRGDSHISGLQFLESFLQRKTYGENSLYKKELLSLKHELILSIWLPSYIPQLDAKAT